jgi:hypothetical protein
VFNSSKDCVLDDLGLKTSIPRSPRAAIRNIMVMMGIIKKAQDLPLCSSGQMPFQAGHLPPDEKLSCGIPGI